MGQEKPPDMVKVAEEVPLTQLLALKSLMGFGDRGYFYLNRFLGLNFGKKIPSHPIIRPTGGHHGRPDFQITKTDTG